VPASSTRLQQSEPRETGNPWHLNLMSGQRVAWKMRLVYNQDSQPGACQQHSGSSSCDAGSHKSRVGSFGAAAPRRSRFVGLRLKPG